MDHIREIQEIVDEHKEQLPTGVVTDVMEQCQFAYDALPNLWKISYVQVDAFSKNNAEWELKTAIFEEAELTSFRDEKIPYRFVFAMHKMPKAEWHYRLCFPAFNDTQGRVLVVTGVEKWGRKRSREG
jgi:hypothetical protein